jgi:diguanylate cyclase (GGDEF)-like protein/hemerythrin-like metal-binding protein/PAS domain S-box-containing protein
VHANANLKDVFVWSSRFETGLQDIDQQHSNLVQMINSLAQLAIEGATRETLVPLLVDLKNYARVHFQTEEDLMQHYELDADFVGAHIRAHQSLSEQIRIVCGLVDESETNAGAAVGRLLPLLTKWLLFHVLGTDMRMAHEIKALIHGESREQAEETAIAQQSESLVIVLDALNDITDNLTQRTTQLQETNQRLRVSEARYALAQRAAGIGSWELNPVTRDLSCSAETEPLFGFRLRSFKRPFDGLIACVAPEDRTSVLATIDSMCHGSSIFSIQYRIIWPDGSTHWISAIGERIAGNGEPDRVVGIMRDITEEKLAREQLQDTNKQLKLSLASVERHAADLTTLIELNEGLQSCLNVSKAFEVVEHTLDRLSLGSGGALAVATNHTDGLKVMARWGNGGELLPTFANETCWSLRRGQRHVIRHASDGPMCKHFASPFANPYICQPLQVLGETLGLLCVRALPDVGEHEWERITHLTTMVAESLKLALANIKLRESLHEQAIRDPLTKLLNRRYLDETLPREIIRAQREHRALSLAMLDLDHFKMINDCWGHEAGDIVLAHIAAILLQYLRVSDLACRFGGEEFVVVMLGASITEAHKRVEEIADRVRAEPARLLQATLPVVTFSAGIAQAGLHGNSAEDLLRAADRALYTAKGAGRNCICEADQE